MTDKQLRTRVNRIKDEEKLRRFMQALLDAHKDELADAVSEVLDRRAAGDLDFKCRNPCRLMSKEFDAQLKHHAELSARSLLLLARLEKKLKQVNQLVLPIGQLANTLAWAERNITSASEASDECLDALTTAKRVEVVLKFGPRRDLEGFLSSLEQLQSSMAYCESHNTLKSAQQAYAYSERLHHQAMTDCLREFSHELHQAVTAPSAAWLMDQAANRLQECVDGAPTDVHTHPAVQRATRLASVMLGAGWINCLDSYASLRGAAIDEAFVSVGAIGSMTAASLQMQSPEQLERIVGSWSVQLRVLLVVGVSELQLARHVWPPPYDEVVFQEIMSRSLRQLIGVGKGITETRRVPEKVFLLMDVHRHLTEVQSGLVSMLGGMERCAGLLADFLTLSHIIATSTRASYAEFEQGIARDSSKVALLSGSIHPLCARTLAHMKRLFSYPHVGELLFGRSSEDGRASDEDEDADEDEGRESHAAALTERMADSLYGVMDRLVEAMEVKARDFRSPALGHIFRLNNFHYMVGENTSHIFRLNNFHHMVGENTSHIFRLNNFHYMVGENTSHIFRLNNFHYMVGENTSHIFRLNNFHYMVGENTSHIFRLNNFHYMVGENTSHIFRLNNFHYMVGAPMGENTSLQVWTLEKSAVLEPLGVGWVAGNASRVETAAADYHEASWTPLVQGLKTRLPKEEKAAMDTAKLGLWVKEKLKVFNAGIDVIRATQCGWSIPDRTLRAAVRDAIKQDVLPVVDAFHRQYGALNFAAQPSKYLQYDEGALQAMVDNELFEANPAANGTRTSK
ncbi:MAG: hypothetical protein WDW38_003084 [Sanguina aurantia]